MNTSHLQNPSFGDYKVLCHALWILFISIFGKDKGKERETRAHLQHPHVVLIEIAVLKCLWLYATCVEQQRTWLSYRIMRYSLYFCMSGSAFLVSGVLKAQSRGKSWRVRDTRDLRTMCLQQGTSVAELREKCRCPVSWTCCARTEQFSPRCISLSSLHNSSRRLEALCE